MKKGTCQSISTSASQLVKKKKKNGLKKYTQSKHQSKKSANQKNDKAAETIPPKNGKLHVEKPRRQKTDVAVATTK